MFVGKLVFAQLMDFLPLHTFRRCVARYPSNYPTKTFSHLDQFLCMAFAQLAFRESLRDIEVCLRAQESKLYRANCKIAAARRNFRFEGVRRPRPESGMVLLQQTTIRIGTRPCGRC